MLKSVSDKHAPGTDPRFTKRAQAIAEKRIEALYYKHCAGVQINVMDIGKVFRAGRDCIAANGASVDDQTLTRSIIDTVQKIRKN